MKNFLLAIIVGIFIYFNQAQSKSLKSYYGNSIDHLKTERKPFASPLNNAIYDNYKRAKRQIPQGIIKFQEALNKAKHECVREMELDGHVLEKHLMYEENPTDKEKCLMKCMLKKTKLMENGNKISTKTVARITSAMSENNPLVVSVAVATANNCNKLVTAVEPCEAAYQINKCIGNELKTHKLKIHY